MKSPHISRVYYSATELLELQIKDLEVDIVCAERDNLREYATECRCGNYPAKRNPGSLIGFCYNRIIETKQVITNQAFFKYPENTIVYLVISNDVVQGSFKTKQDASKLEQTIGPSSRIEKATMDKNGNFVLSA